MEPNYEIPNGIVWFRSLRRNTMTIQLEIGKTYLNRLGEQVTIISQNTDKKYPFNSVYTSYTPDGKYFYNNPHDNDRDLVVEDTEPTKQLYDITKLVEDLYLGEVFYTKEGDKVHMVKGKLLFNTEKLDLIQISQIELLKHM